MRLALLGGVSLAILATTPALAEQPVSNAAIVARLNALEAKVDSLEARNADLEHQLAAQKAAVSTAPQFAPQATGVAAHPLIRRHAPPPRAAPTPRASSRSAARR